MVMVPIVCYRLGIEATIIMHGHDGIGKVLDKTMKDSDSDIYKMVMESVLEMDKTVETRIKNLVSVGFFDED